MKCPGCQHDNAATVAVCTRCGLPLVRSCPKCDAAVVAGAKFCGECGQPLRLRDIPLQNFTPPHLVERILTSRAEVEGERKQVTVLFADMTSSFELIADRDPEDAQRLIDPVISHMMEAVHHFEGTVHRVLGDGLMALFGAPLSHEDHAVRACYAALRMREAIGAYADELQRTQGMPVSVRIGLNSGEIVISTIGNDLNMVYTVVGSTLHLASRMEKMARPGSVLATADTIHLAEGYVTVKRLGPVPVRGLSHPVEVCEVLGSSVTGSKFEAAARRGLTRFVGREAEMRQLAVPLERAGRGRGQAVSVSGEPGVGKSRLIYELLHSPAVSGWLVLEARAQSYGRASPYLPIIDLLKGYFAVNARDFGPSIREKVTRRILALEATLDDVLPPILDLLGALDQDHAFHALEPVQHRQLTYQAVIRLLLNESRRQPLILLFEDLHWSDSLTLGLLDGLMMAAADTPLVLLRTFRPEFRDGSGEAEGHLRLHLDPLGNDSLARLLLALLGNDANLLPLKQFLRDRAGGNPFFVEEIVRSLVDGGTLIGERGNYRLAEPFDSLKVPSTVQTVLAARIDALPPAGKRLLQEAAVVGHDVPLVLLQQVSGLGADEIRRQLNDLQDAELLHTTQLFPDLHYGFKHALTHDVAYAGLLNERRRSIHARVVDAMEMLYGDRLGEHVERIAGHALRGQLWEKAVRYLRQAGAKAADREAYREALSLFEQAQDALAHLPEARETLEQAVDLRFDIRNVLQPLGDRSRIVATLQEAEALARKLEDDRRLGWIQSYFAENFWMLGQYAEAVAAGARARAIAAEVGDAPMRIVTNLPLGLAHHTRGDYPHALEVFGDNVDRLTGAGLRERYGMFVLPAAFARSFMAWAWADLGEFGRGIEIGEEALHIAQDAQHPFSCGYAYLCLGVVALRRGEMRRALRRLERALAAGAFADSPVGFAYVALHLGYGYALNGQPEKGLPLLDRSVEVAEARGFVARHALRLAYLAEARLIAGRVEDAASTAERALELARRHDERANEAYAMRILGEARERLGKHDDAVLLHDRALTLAAQLRLRPLQAHCHRSLGRLFRQLGDRGRAQTHADASMALRQEMSMHFWTADP